MVRTAIISIFVSALSLLGTMAFAQRDENIEYITMDGQFVPLAPKVRRDETLDLGGRNFKVTSWYYQSGQFVGELIDRKSENEYLQIIFKVGVDGRNYN